MNKEKYSDPTAEKAIAHVMKEEKRKNKNEHYNKNELKLQRQKQ